MGSWMQRVGGEGQWNKMHRREECLSCFRLMSLLIEAFNQLLSLPIASYAGIIWSDFSCVHIVGCY